MAIDLQSSERMGAGLGTFGTWPSEAQLRAVARKALSPAAWIESLRRNLAAEENRWLPWAVVAFAGGDAFYFNLLSEPAAWIAVAAAMAAAVCFVTSIRMAGSGFRFLCILLAAIGFGFAAAKLRTDMVTAPVISREMGPMCIEGRVESVSDLTKGQRVIFAPSKLGKTNNLPLPHRLRLTLKNAKTNVLADFSVAFVVMPSAAIAVILMPFGLDKWPLEVMGWGVQRMMDVAHWVGGLPGAVMLVPSWPLVALLLIVAGGLWIGIWRRRWRWFGLVPLAAGLAFTTAGAPADVLIARDAKTAAVRQADGTLAILGNHPDDYTAKQWLLRQGDARDWEIARKAAPCDDNGCVAKAVNGNVVAFAQRADALADDCARADVLVSATPVRIDCPHPRLIVDRLQLARKGATAIWLNDDGARMETVAEARGTRPWVAQYRRTKPTKRP